jgi:hypothetical protein
MMVRLTVVNRQTQLDFMIQRLLNIANHTYQDEFAGLTVLGSRTHGIAERRLNRRKECAETHDI